VSGAGDSPSLRCFSYDATNHCSGFGYDPAGNVTGYAGRTLGYDVENRQIALQEGANAPVWNYFYDGEGRRVKKTGDGTTTVYVYDAFGKLAAEYSSAPAADQPDCTTCYLTADHLGSTRLVTDGVTGEVRRRYDYEPFGLSMNAGTDGRSTSVAGYEPADEFNLKFTGKQRDYESGLQLDYFGARYFGSAMGRFTSADALDHPSKSPKGQAAFLSNPQNWSKYAYVLNNPLIRIDPDGMADYLYLESNVAKSTGASLAAGHANLARFNSDTNKTTTYGLWPDSHPAIVAAGLANGKGSDVRTNFADDAPANYPLKYGVELTIEQSSALDATVAKPSEWGYTNTCATWAASTFTSVTGVKMGSSEYGGITDTPRAIGDSINAKVATNPSAGVFPPGPGGAPRPAPKPTPPSSVAVTPKEPRRPFDDK
jgi:RHS repeat-associated protein